MIRIINSDCKKAMEHMYDGSVDIILTSPPYNTNKKTGRGGLSDNKGFPYVRYDLKMDAMTNEEYTDWMLGLFQDFNRILRKDGCILWNMNYGANNTELLFTLMADIIRKSDFTIVDIFCWKKKCAVPNNVSKNRMTRIWEPVFVIARKSEVETFDTNKKISSVRKNGQVMYSNVMNYIDAKNNDGVCKFNRSTFSSELCEKLLSIYGIEGGVVFDPFAGSGTTAVAAKKMNMSCICCELSSNQCKFAAERTGSIVELSP